MLTGGLAERYAKALMEAALEKGAAKRAAAEIRTVAQLCAAGSELAACLDAPIVTDSVKKNIITALLGGKALPLTIDFLCLLIEKKRFELLAVIGDALDALIRAREGVALVSVASALPVNAADDDYFKQRLEKWLGSKVQLSIEHKPSLLCGMQIRIGDRFFDGSGLGWLAQIRAAFSAV